MFSFVFSFLEFHSAKTATNEGPRRVLPLAIRLFQAPITPLPKIHNVSLTRRTSSPPQEETCFSLQASAIGYWNGGYHARILGGHKSQKKAHVGSSPLACGRRPRKGPVGISLVGAPYAPTRDPSPARVFYSLGSSLREQPFARSPQSPIERAFKTLFRVKPLTLDVTKECRDVTST